MPDKPIVYLGADHGGFDLKRHLREYLFAEGYPCVDEGDAALEMHDDYPVYAVAVAAQVAADRADGRESFGILVCRSASGMVMSAGKVVGIRGTAAFDEDGAEHSRADNDSNVLALAGDRLDQSQAESIVSRWLSTPTSAEERHVRRRAQIERLETYVPEVLPGIFETSVAEVQALAGNLAKLTGLLHIDVADGEFVPAAALAQPDDLAKLNIKADLEVHLMVNEPAKYLEASTKTGFHRAIAHIEAPGFADFMSASTNVQRLVALDLGSDATDLDPYLDKIDGVVLMAVKAGLSGQAFSLDVLAPLVDLKRRYKGPITVDGGVSDRTAAPLVVAGADRLVANSFISKSNDPATAVKNLQNIRGPHA